MLSLRAFMLLSIVIPAYNVADCVGRALQSALPPCIGQNLEYEVIAVDDGSTDGTCDIITAAARAHGNLRLISTAHAGVSHARNTGLKAALGEYVTFLDADDSLVEHGLEILLGCIARGPKADTIVMNMATIGRRGYDYDWRPLFPPCRAYAAKDLMQSPYYRHSACGMAYRRSSIRDVCFDTALYNSEDAIWVGTLFARNVTVEFVDADLYLRHLRPGSASRTYGDARTCHDWTALQHCARIVSKADTQLSRLVFSRLLYDLTHNMLLHVIKGHGSLRATLHAYPVHKLLCQVGAPRHAPLKYSLLRRSPLLYGLLLTIKHRLRVLSTIC